MFSLFAAALSACANTYVVTTTADSGAGSLRAAIKQANGHANAGGPDVIHFNIPGTGVHRISPVDPLPAIVQPLILDGYSQPGASENTETKGDNAVLLIELNGALRTKFRGLKVFADHVTVRGLVINEFDQGLYASGNGDVIEGNFIGTNASGTQALPNNEGIGLASGTVTLGGSAPASRNIVSGNTNTGISIDYGTHTLQGNFIGVDASGATALGNGTQDQAGDGILVDQAGNAVIGGTTAGTGNVISGNHGSAILISYSGQGTGGIVEILGNRIGVSAAGTNPVPNDTGIYMKSPGEEPTVVRVGIMLDGTTPVRVPNTIAFNVGAGIRVDQGTVTITRNAIYGNKGLGIDLGGDGVTPNDQGDGDDGANGLQNFPLLTSATVSQRKVTIAGSFNSKPNKSYRIEFFGSGSKDGSGYGEGRWLLGATNVTTNGAGNATINSSFQFTAVGSSWVTATATDASGSTSEFSRAVILAKP